VLERELARNELRDARIHLELRQVDGGHLVLTCEHPGEVGFLHVTELDQVIADTRAIVSLLSERLVELVLGYQALFQE